MRPIKQRKQLHSTVAEEEPEEQPSKPLCETLVDLQLQSEERNNISEQGNYNQHKHLEIYFEIYVLTDRERTKAHFFVHCSQCGKLSRGKLRVRCSFCKGGAFTVHRDPECWDDVLKSRRIRGHCESLEIACVDNQDGDPPFAEFYFKCAEHVSGGEKDFAAPLNLVKNNIHAVPCLACTDVR